MGKTYHMQVPDGVDGLDCYISRLMNSRDLLRISQVICCQIYIHFSLLDNKVSQIVSPVITPSCNSRHLTFLHNVSTSPSFRKHWPSKVSMPWSSTICLGSMCTPPKVFKSYLHACLHHFFLSFLSWVFFSAYGKI